MKRLLFLLIFPIVLFTSCRGIFGKRVNGDGNLKTESRSPGQFDEVEVSGSIDLYVKQDSARSVKIEADANLMEYIEVFTEADKLVVRTRNGFNLRPTQDIKVYVSSPVYKKFELSGACDIYSENQIVSSDAIELGMSGSCDGKIDVKTPKVSTDLSGACSIEIKGETKELTAGGSGSTTFKCFGLMAENVSVDISGAGDAEVYASVKLDVDVSGAAGVKYKGNASVSQKVTGAGSVKKVE
ncbi:MAG: head GIN domain-containing protein [Bacteroidota bacterium]